MGAWFPAGAPTDPWEHRFLLRTEAANASGSVRGMPWAPDTAGRERARAVLTNAASVAGNPVWLRERAADAVDWVGMTRAGAGWDEAPRPDGARDDQGDHEALDFEAGVGAVAAAQPYPRLR
jgi:hypothetical protein